jgi:hypothetical protein
MNGMWIDKDGCKDPQVVEQFHTNVNKMFASSDKLRKWNAQKLSDNFKVLGFDDDVSLNNYLAKVTVKVDRSEAFGEMCDFLFGIPRL